MSNNAGPGHSALSVPTSSLPSAILHLDMDAFFASVEQRDDPKLRGKPTLVAGRPPRGVVLAASYESRVFGCRSAMPTAEALQRCPHAIIVKSRFAAYRQASDQVFEIMRQFTPLVQGLSIDEAFLDVTGSQRLFGDAVVIAGMLRERVREATGLTCSVGVAPNKFLAKLASDLNKPDGLTVIRAEDVREMLGKLPVEKLWGIGPATLRRLHRFGVKSVADLRLMPDDFFERKRSGVGWGIRRLADGIDDRPVVPERKAKSIGSEQTFGIDIGDREELRRLLLGHVEHVTARLRQAGRVARSVSLKLRTGQSYRRFVTIGRSATLAMPTDSTSDVWETAARLFDAWANEQLQPLRLLGVSLGELDDIQRASQLELFADEKSVRQRAADAVVDAVTKKMGRGAVRRGL